eukprot:s181_g35.t1
MSAAPSNAGELKQRSCKICGLVDHRSRECPLLVELDGSETEPEMVIDTGYHNPPRKATATKSAPKRQIRHPEALMTSIETPSTLGWDVVSSELTSEEIAMINKRRQKAAVSRSKRENQKALTGEAADYPSLSQVWSQEVALNMVFSLACMRTFLWKKMLWQLRVKVAVERMTGARWKRNPRWLAGLLAKRQQRCGGTMGNASASELSGRLAHDVKSPLLKHLQRGDTQRLKRGANLGRKQAALIAKTAKMEGKCVLVEIYAGTAKLTRLANETYGDRWKALPPH